MERHGRHGRYGLDDSLGGGPAEGAEAPEWSDATAEAREVGRAALRVESWAGAAGALFLGALISLVLNDTDVWPWGWRHRSAISVRWGSRADLVARLRRGAPRVSVLRAVAHRPRERSVRVGLDLLPAGVLFFLLW
ncbi:MAG TPA: hypothetical protein VKA84_01510 [Gemmatimonadaceae bacterium]|nr:hypothetical protein [Gemmatimonadaceae bacterium]